MQEDTEEKRAEPSTEPGQETAEEPNSAPDPDPEPDPRDVLIEQLLAERTNFQEEAVRALAEAQTIQRRLRDQHREAMHFASEPLVHELLPVLDNFERTLSALDKGVSPAKLLKGVKAAEKQLRRALEKSEVERIKALGEKFDPELHEALATTVSEEHDEGTVAVEIEPGYKMRGRVIRPAKVHVTKKP